MKNIVVSILVGIAALVHTQAHAVQVNIPGPLGSGKFGNAVTVLPNGNIVVTDPDFDASASILDVGAVYLFRPDGVQISVIKGDKVGDRVGSSGVTVLSNGHFVISSPEWGNNGALKAGAVTFGNATGGNMIVSAQNSLVGTQADDQVGYGGVVPLSNGHYVVNSFYWRNGSAAVGANTWAMGNGLTVGALSATNSLIGSQAFDIGRAVALTNGNYVVHSSNWDNGAAIDAGAVTWCSGASGCTGLVSTANSLVGSQTDDNVGELVTPLSNGNYVVVSTLWKNGDTPRVGAATWRSGAAGGGGVVSSSNSMIGTQAFDNVSNGGITALSNGHYVIASPTWDNGQNGVAGAATWGNGVSGSVGVVSIANSLVGEKANDSVGASVKALSNGNYVVASYLWNNGAVPDAGAVTWGNGSTGTTGLVSTANSLTGSQVNDRVGFGVTALSNGNYVVESRSWDNGGISGAGAATWRSGLGPTPGVVIAGNSLVGNKSGDNVGTAVTALSNGDYVVGSPVWANGATAAVGAVTKGNGATGFTGVVSSANSNIGSIANDRIGSLGVDATADGRYIIGSPLWNSGGIADAGATTLQPSGIGSAAGPIVSANSVLGTVANGGVGINHSYDALRKQLAVGRPAQNIVSLLSLGQATSLSIVSHTPNPSAIGQAVAVVFDVTAANAPTGGTVNIFSSGAGVVGCTDTTPTPVNATTVRFGCDITFANAGNYPIEAEFLGLGNGSSGYSRSQTGVLHTVSAIAPVLFANGFESIPSNLPE